MAAARRAWMHARHGGPPALQFQRAADADEASASIVLSAERPKSVTANLCGSLAQISLNR